MKLNNRIRGLKSAITHVQKAIDANKQDIVNGIDFRWLLAENQVKLERLEAKMRKLQSSSGE